MGLGDIAANVRNLWKEGHHQEAAAAIPTTVIEQLVLIGPPGKIREELPAWRNSQLTTMLVHAPLHQPVLRQLAELILG